MKRKRLSMDITEDQHKELKLASVNNNMTMKELVESSLRHYALCSQSCRDPVCIICKELKDFEHLYDVFICDECLDKLGDEE